MSPSSVIATREASEAKSPQKPARLTRFPEKELSQIRTRLDVIGRQPNPGRLARKLRQRKRMSIQDVGSALDVNSDLVDLFEKSGDIRIWTDLATTRLFSDGREHEESGEELLDRFIEFLRCRAEEQEMLRHDPRAGGGLPAHAQALSDVRQDAASRRGVPLPAAMAMSGHRSVSAASRYVRASEALRNEAARLAD